MADAQLTDAQRDLIFNRLGFLLGIERGLNVWIRHVTKVGTDEILCLIINGDEAESLITDIQLNAVNIATDLSVDGIAYGRIVDGGAGTGHQIQFYSDQPRTSLVAQTPATVDDNQTGTISPQAGFTLAGTISIGPITANVDLAIAVVEPLYARASDVFDGTEAEDQALEAATKQALDRMRSSMITARNQIRAVVSQLMLGLVTRFLVTASEDSALIQPNLREEDGTILEEPRGRLEDLRRAMLDNTGGSGVISVLAQSATPTLSFPGTFQGIGTSPSMTDRALATRITFTCTKGLDDTAPTFVATSNPTDPRRRAGANFDRTIDAEFPLTIGKPWKSQTLGVASLEVDYSATVTNEVGTPLDTTASLWKDVQGLTANNSNAGEVYALYTTADLTLRFYRSAAERDQGGDNDGLIASVVNPGTTSAFTATGAAGITIQGTTGAALNNNDKAKVNYNPPQATLPFSYFTLDVAVTVEPSLFQALIRDGAAGNAPWRIHSTGSPNILSGLVSRGQLPPGGARLFGDVD